MTGSDVVDFYNDKGEVGGKSFDDWLLASNIEWRDDHSFIQWLFPLMYESANAPGAFLDENSLKAFKRGRMQGRMRLAFERFVAFLGFEGKAMILPLHYYDRIDLAKKRISRVLASTHNIGLKEEGYKLLGALIVAVPHHQSMIHWKDACLGAAWSHSTNRACLREIERANAPIVIDDAPAENGGSKRQKTVIDLSED